MQKTHFSWMHSVVQLTRSPLSFSFPFIDTFSENKLPSSDLQSTQTPSPFSPLLLSRPRIRLMLSFHLLVLYMRCSGKESPVFSIRIPVSCQHGCTITLWLWSWNSAETELRQSWDIVTEWQILTSTDRFRQVTLRKACSIAVKNVGLLLLHIASEAWDCAAFIF